MPLHLQGTDTAYCVPFSLLGIAEYFGIHFLTTDEMIELCGTHKKSGSQLEIVSKVVKKIGMKFKRIRFNIKNVRKSLEHGNPVVVCYATSKDEGHFSTIIDVRVDKRKNGFYTLNDTYYGRYEIPENLLVYLMYRDGSWARTVEKT